MGKRSVVKGKAWEREVAQLLRPVFGEEVRRGIGQARSSSEVADVEVPAAAKLWVEAKHGKLVNLRAALAQAIEASAAAGDGRRPVVIAKDDRASPVVVMTLDSWLELVGEWWLTRQPPAAVPVTPSTLPAIDRGAELRAQGMAWAEIASQLNAEGLFSPAGQWTSTEIARAVIYRTAEVALKRLEGGAPNA